MRLTGIILTGTAVLATALAGTTAEAAGRQPGASGISFGTAL